MHEDARLDELHEEDGALVVEREEDALQHEQHAEQDEAGHVGQDDVRHRLDVRRSAPRRTRANGKATTDSATARRR